MQIKAIASGSKGNAYAISHNKSRLLIDAGISINKIRKALNYQLSGIDGVLISHSHKDHCLAVKDLLKLGIFCYMSDETVRELNINGHRVHRIMPLKQQKIGSWLILPFDLIHDSEGALGFLIMINGKSLLYASDTAYIKYKSIKCNNIELFNDFTHIMVECNYSLDVLKEKIKTGETPQAMKYRLLHYHMNLDTVKNFLKTKNLHKVEEIWLLHLSDRNSDSAKFKEEIQKLTGKIIKIA